jgi:hypothetical protein
MVEQYCPVLVTPIAGCQACCIVLQAALRTGQAPPMARNIPACITYTCILFTVVSVMVMVGVFPCLPACLSLGCRFESVIFTVPPVLAPLLGAVYVRSYGRKAGIMLGCIIMLIGQVSQVGPLH